MKPICRNVSEHSLFAKRGGVCCPIYVCNSSTNECESNNNVHCMQPMHTTTWTQLQCRCYRVPIVGAVAAVGIVAQTVTHWILPLLSSSPSPSPFQAMCAFAIQLQRLKLCASDFWWMSLVRVCLFVCLLVFTYMCAITCMNEWMSG